MPSKEIKIVEMLVKGSHISLKRKSPKILVIQLGDIGDVVLTTPSIKALKKNLSDSEVCVVVREHGREIMEACPWVDELKSVKKEFRNFIEGFRVQKEFFDWLRRKKFDCVVDLRTGTRGAIISLFTGSRLRIGRHSQSGPWWRNALFTHLVSPENEFDQYSSLHNFNILAPLEVACDDFQPKLYISPEMKKRAYGILEQESVPADRPIIALHPFSRWSYKEWSIENYITLIKYIESLKRFYIVITGSPGERERVSEIASNSDGCTYNLAGKTSVGELAAVLKECTLLIGIDTAAVHIAAAVGISTISIFGPSSPVNWAPRGEKHHYISKDFACVPCGQKGCFGSEVSRCLDELRFEEVFPLLDRTLVEINASDRLWIGSYR